MLNISFNIMLENKNNYKDKIKTQDKEKIKAKENKQKVRYS